ncbi:Trehalose utilization [Novipirellula galeiformis]|uniref:Trehalose utilization n=1 Tax=Novipirellula galeiformis TaxID=2528004 RepID=A0A5C6CND7_9BACT|nr:ThuA domain-containing protein [Novipirellula galeiformis]TWU24974.1 Trehalose utilization [Novipirellula galeiformis]
MRQRLTALAVFTLGVALLSAQHSFAEDGPLVYQGDSGIGSGKHLVFLAGDHEYRSEEALPALARILAKRHGFKCTVLFNLDPKTGFILPGNSHMPHTEVIDSADLLVFGLRFQNFPAPQMQPIVDYLKRGGPVVGVRTSTHAFKIPTDSPFAKYDFQYKGAEMKGGFGRQVLGETWAGHYGKNHVMSTRLEIVPENADHPILRGVKDLWVQAGGYWTDPEANCVVLANAQPLQGMAHDSPPAKDKQPCPGAWVRTYQSESGTAGRVFTTTYCASEDILNDGFRRLMINGCLWALGSEDNITDDLNVEFVGPYDPSTFSFEGHRKNVKPLDLSGWDSPIMPRREDATEDK